MNVFSIDVPQYDNAKLAYSHNARQAFLQTVLDHAGGYRVNNATGLWRDPENGELSVDALDVISFCVAPEYESEALGAIKLQFSQSFPDQKALYISRVGTCEVITL